MTMTKLKNCLLAATCLFAATTAAQAQDVAGPLTISGSAAVASQYRFRGISLSDEDMAVQAGLSAAHESGLYVGTWGSSLAGFGTFGGSNIELDVYGGYKTTIGALTVDAGLLWYLYPGTDGTDYAEPYASVSGTLGPVSAKLGVAYAPDQKAIGGADSLYVYNDLAAAVPNTPFTLKTHIGYTSGKGSTLAGPDGDYMDWSLGVDTTYKNLTLGVAYVDTDIKTAPAEGYFLGGHSIVDGTVLVSLTAAF